MKNEVKLFESEVFGSLTVLLGEDSKPVFLAKDVAKALDYRDAHNLTRVVDTDYMGTHTVSTLGGDQKISTISEYGIIEAVLKSRKPEAKAFKKWVIEDIIPSVLKTGKYDVREDPKLKGRVVQLVDMVFDSREELVELKDENNHLMIETVNNKMEKEDLIKSRSGHKGQFTQKRNLLDSIKDLLGIRNDRDVTNSLTVLMEDYVDMKKVIHGPNYKEFI